MDRLLKKLKIRSFTEKIALSAAIAIAVVLAIAAWGKMFYPSEYLKILDRWISAFEILFLLAILFFRKRWQIWLTASILFSAWGGYALYWGCVQLPCACMGRMLNIPSVLSISFDFIFALLSLFITYLLGKRFKWIYFGILSGCLAVLVGYAFADYVYKSL